MAYNLNGGIGTTFFGRDDIRVDRSYITTEWLILLWTPIFPLGSYRVTEGKDGIPLFSHRKDFKVMQRIPLQWRQVRRIYTPFLAAMAGMALMVYFGPGGDIQDSDTLAIKGAMYGSLAWLIYLFCALETK